MDKRRVRSFNKILEICSSHKVEPLFSITDYRGQTEIAEGKTVSVRYKVKCLKCGSTYEAWFKTASNRMMECTSCGKGHRDIDASYFEALDMCKANGREPLFNKEAWKGKSKEYKVKCLECGFVHTTTFRGKLRNCPYCKESKNPDMQYDKVRKIFADSKLTLLDTEYRPTFTDGKRTKYKVRCEVCGTEFQATFIGHKTTVCPTCCDRKQRSNRERMVCDFLDSNGYKVYPNYRDCNIKVNGHIVELDIYLPELKVAFEFNGQAFHNGGPGLYHKEKDYHKLKTEACLSKGIKLYHIWDFVSDKLCMSIVSTKVGLNNRVYARKCDVAEISGSDAKQFLTTHHVDGFVKSSVYYGLFYEGRLVACLTLLNRRVQSIKGQVWEIGRFATEFNTTVVGGYSRLLKVAIKHLKENGVKELVSYCNRDLSPDPEGTFYSKEGFTFVQDSGMIYWYWASKSIKLEGLEVKHGGRVSRQVCQKSKLITLCKTNNLTLTNNSTEKGLAESLGLYPCYNSGNFKYVMSI